MTLVVYGTAESEDEAIKIALRSAIEQAFGTFVSANTEVLNDELVKDEIATMEKVTKTVCENTLSKAKRQFKAIYEKEVRNV